MIDEPAQTMLSSLSSQYDAGAAAPSLSSLLARISNPAADEICDLVEADVCERVARSLPITLARYLDDLGDRAAEPEVLDTILDLVLQRLVVNGLSWEAAAQILLSERPDLAGPIRETVTLGQSLAMSSLETTAGARRRAAAPPPPRLGADVHDHAPRYEILDRLGAGAFGAVYRAIDHSLSGDEQRSEVALKILDAPGGPSLAEAARARRVRHSSVVRVYDHGATPDGRGFIVYELVEGRTLRQVITDSGPMAPREAARLVALIADGVHAAHAVQVLHRDLNPGNVILDSSGAPRVTDFGVSAGIGERPQSPVRSQPLGAPGFVAHEQWGAGAEESVATDVYGLGGLLFYLLTGHCPNGATFEEVRLYLEGHSDRSRQMSLLSGVPRDLRLITLRALDPEPERRSAAAAHIAEDLRLWMLHRPVPWTEPGPAHKARLLLRRRPIATSAAAIAVVALGASLAIAGSAVGKLRSYENLTFSMLQRMRAGVANLKEEGQLSSIPTALTAFESIKPGAHVGLYADPAVTAELRLLALDRLVEESLAHFGADDPRTLMWRNAAALCRLTLQRDVPETLAYVTDLREQWSQTLAPDSPWMKEMDAWVLSARIKALYFRNYRTRAPLSPTERAELAAMVHTLESSLPMFDGWLNHSPTHDLVLRALTVAHHPVLLNQPDHANRFTAMRDKR